MRTLFLFAATLFVFTAAARSATAVPTAFYNPATGGITFSNDYGEVLPALFLQSTDSVSHPGQFTSDTSKYAQFSGATFDPGDLPNTGFTYLNFPNGTFFIGDVVTPHTPKEFLQLGYYGVLLIPQRLGDIVVVPEPSAASLIAVGLFALAAITLRGRLT